MQVNLTSAYVKFVLRPLTVLAAVWSLYSLIHRSWASTVMLLAAWFMVSVIGSDMIKPTAMDQMKAHGDEAYVLAKGGIKIVSVGTVLIAIFMITRGSRWYFALPVAGLLAASIAFIPMMAVACVVGLQQRRNADK